MSKRREAGEWVRCKPNVGFVGDSDRLRAQIQPEEDKYRHPCFGLNGCEDPACREWATLHTEPDPESNGERGIPKQRSCYRRPSLLSA